MQRQAQSVRWYREPWPWILMAAPAAAVLAGAVTLALAVRSSDGLVAEDYYKQGLAVNQQLARVEAAQARGLEGTLALDPSAAGPVELRLRAGAGELPAAVDLVLSHPTRAGLDRRVRLVAAGGARYVGRIEPLAPGRWHATVEDDGRRWRIAGDLQAPQARGAELAPGQ